jgi:hypothetical protein
MGYDYGFEYAFPDAMGGAAVGVATGILLIVWCLAMGFSIVMYVLNAVGLYRIAKRRGIHHAWLAWVPIGSNWLLGSISDHYQYVAKQKVTSKRKILLILSLCLIGCLFVLAGGVVAIVVAAGSSMNASIALGVVLLLIAYLGMMGLAIAITVFCYIAYYDLFRSCKPGNAVLFLVLSILFNVTLAFFVFFSSKSDEGMPERRPRDPAPRIEEAPVEPEAPAEEEIPVVEGEIVEESE